MDRRTFLKYLGQAGLVCGASGWLGDRLWSLEQEHRLPRAGGGLRSAGAPLERWVRTACSQCPGGCGLRVRCYEGFPVALEGDAASPISRGGLCPLGSAGLQVLYHPDRIRQPLVRTREGSKGEWKPISWNEGAGMLLERLSKLRDSGEPHRLAFISGGTSSTMGALIAQFMRSYGSPNLILQDAVGATEMATQLAQGDGARLAYDLPNAGTVLSFGFDMLEAEGAPVWQIRSHGQLRRGHSVAPGAFIQIEPRLSVTAVQADRWIPIRAGSEAALALGIAYVMISEGRYDHSFVAKHTFGFDDWKDTEGRSHIGFKTLVLRDYAPETVTQLTGVSVEDVRLLAHAFSARPGSLAIAGKGAASHTNGLYTQMAVQSLNALAGSIGKPGGLQTAQKAPLAALAALNLDTTARKGVNRRSLGGEGRWKLASNQLGSFMEQIESDSPYPLDILLVHESNPIFSSTNTEKAKQAFSRIPLVVSFASFMDETAAAADLILPDHTYLERWGDMTSVPGIAWPHAILQQPVIPPLYETRHTGDVLIELARALGDATASAFPEPDVQSVLKRRYHGLYASRTGQIAGSGDTKPADSFDAFWSELLSRGAWSAPLEYAPPIFETASGKYDLFAQGLRAAPGMEQEPDEALLPHFEPPRSFGDTTKYPLLLYPFDTNTLFGGKGALLPLTMEMVGFRQNVLWDSWVEVNPLTARQLGIEDGNPVWIESQVGRVRTQVKVWPGVPPDVVSIPVGLGHEDFGRYARGKGVNPNQLLVNAKEGLSGARARLATRVRVVKAS